jgi:hypothetical protein
MKPQPPVRNRGAGAPAGRVAPSDGFPTAPPGVLLVVRPVAKGCDVPGSQPARGPVLDLSVVQVIQFNTRSPSCQGLLQIIIVPGVSHADQTRARLGTLQGPSFLSPRLRQRFSVFSSTARPAARPKIRVLLGRPPALGKVRQNPEQHPSFLSGDGLHWSVRAPYPRARTLCVGQIWRFCAGPITACHGHPSDRFTLPLLHPPRTAASRRRTPAWYPRTGEYRTCRTGHRARPGTRLEVFIVPFL